MLDDKKQQPNLAQNAQDSKEPYERPKLIPLGNVKHVTHQGSSGPH